MTSFIAPSLIILPLVALVIYWLNQRHERKIKDSFDHLIEPVNKDHLFDLPKAQKPASPIKHQPYIPPAPGPTPLRDDLTNDVQLNATIEKAKANISQPKKEDLTSTIAQGQRQQALAASIEAEQARRVNHLRDKLTAIQSKKRQLKKEQIRVKMNESTEQSAVKKAQKRSYDALKPKLNVKIKK